jgi:hypothetical protein
MITKSQLNAMRADAGWLRAGFRANTAIACADHVDELVAEVERLTAERDAMRRCCRRYFRCECGGLIVRAHGNDSPCEKCNRPLGPEIMPDVHWLLESRKLMTERDAYADALRQIDAMLTIPAAEYVPAIQDVFTLIDATLPVDTPDTGG